VQTVYCADAEFRAVAAGQVGAEIEGAIRQSDFQPRSVGAVVF
jgi:hypothetical protein